MVGFLNSASPDGYAVMHARFGRHTQAADQHLPRSRAVGGAAPFASRPGPCLLTRDIAESTKMDMRDIRLPANIRAGLEFI